MSRDWVGGNASVFKTLGASNHCDHERQADDYYATEPSATEWLCKLVELDKHIWEPACGEGHMAKVLFENGHVVKATDLIDRGYGDIQDFLTTEESFDGDIVTNPPYKYARQFVEKAINIVNEGNKVCMFLKLTFLEGKARKSLFLTTPPHWVFVSSARLKCAMNGEFENMGSSATAYAWFVWEKGYKGDTIIKWFN